MNNQENINTVGTTNTDDLGHKIALWAIVAMVIYLFIAQ